MTSYCGSNRVDLINTGFFRLDGGAMFGVVPKVIWEKTNPPDERNRIQMALRVMLVRGHGKTILIDSGIGNHWTNKIVDRYGIDHSQHSLLNGLASVGCKPEEVTDVILTHLHFDHVGGITSSENGQPKMVFANATYWVHEKNLEHAHAPSEKDKASFIESTIEPLRLSAQLRTSSGNESLTSAVSLWITHGHTPGQQLVKVCENGETFFFCGDTIPTQSHLPLPFVMAYDVEPLKTIAEKKAIYEKAIPEKWNLVFSHDPFIEMFKANESMNAKGH